MHGLKVKYTEDKKMFNLEPINPNNFKSFWLGFYVFLNCLIFFSSLRKSS